MRPDRTAVREQVHSLGELRADEYFGAGAEIEGGSDNFMVFHPDRDRFDFVLSGQIQFRPCGRAVSPDDRYAAPIDVYSQACRIEDLASQYHLQSMPEEALSYVREIDDGHSLILQGEAQSLQLHTFDQS